MSDVDDDVPTGEADEEPESPSERASVRRPRRTWPQKLTVGFASLAAVACFAAAGTLAAGQWFVSNRPLVAYEEPRSQPNSANDPGVVVPTGEGTSDAVLAPTPTPATSLAPSVIAEPDAANFLITGADNGDCGADPITEDRSDMGERSDTIMVWRANPKTNQLAVLSFPRDLYVELFSGRKGRINEDYRRDDPDRLMDTLYKNFGIGIDHYVQIDFCAFRKLVDAVDGIEIPFEYPARDQPQEGNPPLFLIEQTGCVRLDGDLALAYVRSRHYQYLDPESGEWIKDPTSDFGRIARQQDFLRRVLGKVIAEGLYDPSVARALITTNHKYLATDPDLTPKKMLEFASALRNFDADSVTSYRIESRSQTINGQQVEIPRIKGENMRSILAIFRGEATLASAPEQVFETTTTVATANTEPSGDEESRAESPDDAESGDDDSSGESDATSATLPTVEAEENLLEASIVPDANVSCNET